MPLLIKNTAAAGFIGGQMFATSGNFTVPAGVYRVGVRMVGGGAYAATGRGDCGKLLEIEAVAVTPGASLPVVIGSAGASGSPTGGASTFNGFAARGGTGQFDATTDSLPAGGVGLAGHGIGTRGNAGVAATAGAVYIFW